MKEKNLEQKERLAEEECAPIAEEELAYRRAVDGDVRPRKRREKKQEPTALTESLDALTMEDFSKRVKRKKKSRGFTATQWVLFSVFFLVFAFAVYKLLDAAWDYAKAKEENDALKELFYSPVSGDDNLAEPLPVSTCLKPEAAMQQAALEESAWQESFGQEENFQLIRARLTKLKSINDDTYGWIKVSGTDIDYPVVQGPDNDYYLRRSFYKSNLNSGSIFVDAACLSPSQNRNTVIYGHNMKDGTMFHSLHNLAGQAYFDSAEIRLMTSEGIYVYEVYSVHRPHEQDRFFHTDFTDAEWQEFLVWTKAQSLFENPNVTPNVMDRVITLSTCISTTTRDEYRFVVHGVLREIITT